MSISLQILHFLGEAVAELAESGGIMWQFGSLAKDVSYLEHELKLHIGMSIELSSWKFLNLQVKV